MAGESIRKHPEAAANRGLSISSEWRVGKANTRLIAKHLEAIECLVLTVFDHALIRRVRRRAYGRKVAGQPGEAVGLADGVRVMLETHAIGNSKVRLHLPLVLDIPAHGIEGDRLGIALRKLLEPLVGLTRLE